MRTCAEKEDANKHRILQAGRLLPSLEARLVAEFDTTLLADQPEPSAFLAAHGGAFEGFVTSAGVGFTADTLARLPNLRVISSFGAGLDVFENEPQVPKALLGFDNLQRFFLRGALVSPVPD